MRLEDIRLTPEEIKEIGYGWMQNYDYEIEGLANAATIKAVKNILNHMNKRDVGGINPEWAISNTFYQALRNL